MRAPIFLGARFFRAPKNRRALCQVLFIDYCLFVCLLVVYFFVCLSVVGLLVCLFVRLFVCWLLVGWFVCYCGCLSVVLVFVSRFD